MIAKELDAATEVDVIGILASLMVGVAPGPALEDRSTLRMRLLDPSFPTAPIERQATPPQALFVPDDAPPPAARRYLMSALGTGVILAAGSVLYWGNDSTRRDEWDLRFDWTSWQRKLDGQAIRFDADRFDMNATSHPLVGLSYFQIARGSGFSYGASYLWAAVSSLIWEYFVEWNENPSINDLVLTPAAGAVLGEATFNLGRFFAAGEPNLVNRTAAAVFSPIAELADWADGRRARASEPHDALGFSTALRHRFLLSVDRVACFLDGGRSDLTAVTLDTALVSHRVYRRPGSATTTVRPGEWTSLGARVLFARGAGVIEGVDFASGTVVGGRYARRYAQRDEGVPFRLPPRGWGAMVGLGSTFDYHARELDAGLDRIASAGLLGPVAELSAERGGVGVRLWLGASYSFAMIQSLAFMKIGGPPGGLAVNTTLANQGYYYGHGVTSDARLAARLGDVELGLAASYGAYWSINGRDRFQERLQSDLAAHDTRATGVATAGLRPWGGPLLIATSLEHIARQGRLPYGSASAGETRAGVGAAFVF